MRDPTTRREPTRRTPGQGVALTARHELRPVAEVARLWNERSGEALSRARVWQILRQAEAKIARRVRE